MVAESKSKTPAVPQESLDLPASSTPKRAAPAPLPAKVLDGGVNVAGGWDGPSWHPHFSDLSDKLQAEALEEYPQGFVTPDPNGRNAIAGKLTVARGWGRPVYALDVEGFGLVHVPEHAVLYNAFASLKLGAYVVVEYQGKKKGTTKSGQTPYIYRVAADPKTALHDGGNSLRPGALVVKTFADDADDAAARGAKPVAAKVIDAADAPF